jgi:adenylate cyclase
MSDDLSAKERKQKGDFEQQLANFDLSLEARGRRILGLLPSDPRCATCLAPFEGPGGTLVKALLNKRRSTMNPLMCNTCEEWIRKLRYGLELEMSMLFADIRGSTPLAESMKPTDFKELIGRFYSETTHVLMHSYAMIDKLAGDAVSGYYLPGIVGEDFAKKAIEAGEKMLQVTGHADPEGPWAPEGVGIHTGVAYYGAMGEGDGLVELTALGDAVNVAARLGSEAAAGELIISDSTVNRAGVNTDKFERRTVDLKGKSEPIDVWVLHVEPD